MYFYQIKQLQEIIFLTNVAWNKCEAYELRKHKSVRLLQTLDCLHFILRDV